MNSKGWPHLVRVWKIFQGRQLAFNCHRGRPQTYKAHRGCHCIHIGSACHCVLPHLCRCYCGHGGPHQKVWWSCQFCWEVNSYAWGVVSPQGPGYFGRTRSWHFCLHVTRAAQWCFHSLGEDIWCTSPLAGNSQGVCCWGDSEFWMPYASGGSHASCPSPAVPTVTAFPRGQRLNGFHGLGGGDSYPIWGLYWVKHLGISKSGKWLHPLPQFLDWLHATWHGSPMTEWVLPGKPNVVGLWHMPKSFGIVSSDNPVTQTTYPSVWR